MRLRFSPVAFSMVFCCIYVAAFTLNLPLFLYYPLHDNLAWGLHPLSGAGPAV